MKRHYARDVTVGAVVLLAAFIFTIGIFSIGSEQRIWVKKVPYKIRVRDANGLQSGSPVRLAGVQVGTINEVHFSEDPNVISIEVELSVEEAHQHRIRQDTGAHVKILTLLGGEKYVELTPGSPSLPALPPGSYISVPEGFGMEQLGQLSAGLAEDIQSISGNVRLLLEEVHKQESLVGRLLLDPNFGRETFSDIASSARLTRETLEGVTRGKGFMGKMLADEQFARETTASIRSTLERIETLLEKLTDEGGVASQALDPNGRVAGAIASLHQASADVQDFTADLKEGKGLAGRLVGDEQYAQELLDNIKKIAADLAEVTDKLKKGEGTVGGFLNDPQLYDDLKNVVRGVKDSKIVGGLIRHYRKKGEKDQLQEQEKLRQQQPGKEQPKQPKQPEEPKEGGS